MVQVPIVIFLSIYLIINDSKYAYCPCLLKALSDQHNLEAVICKQFGLYVLQFH